MSIIEERRPPPEHALALLESFGCAVDRIVSLRQCAWVLGKLSGVRLDWEHDAGYMLAAAWPRISAALNAIPVAERFAWARSQPKVQDLGEFFPAKPKKRRKPVAAAPVAPGNVVDLAEWRARRVVPRDEPRPAA